ncbi:HVA22-like protein f [Glycine soja]|nr:HVA22-like protein f [Glycine soja]
MTCKNLFSQQQRTFIQMRTVLKVVDNSGAKKVMCIQALKGKKGARLGDTIIASVKEAHPNGKVKKGKVVYGVVVRAAMQKGRCDGSEVKFDDNAVVLVDKQGQPIGTRVFGPVPHELRQKKHGKEDFWVVPQTFFACFVYPARTSLYIPLKLLASISNSTLQLIFHHIVSDFNLLTTKDLNNSFFNMGILGTMARNLDTIVGPGVLLLYPLYASMRAIESPSTLDDQQWLTYWVLYSFITLFELSCYKILAWFPIWPYMKLVFCLWLVLPMFNGAAYIYENYVRQYVKNIGSYYGNSKYPEEQKKVLQMMSLDARKAVERYIDTHGSDAFERVIKAADREARRH